MAEAEAAGLAGRNLLLPPEEAREERKAREEREGREGREVCHRRQGLRIAADGDGVTTATALITVITVLTDITVLALQVSRRPLVATAPIVHIVRIVPSPLSPPSHRYHPVRQGSPDGLSPKSR